jgi:hypothetical protein
VARLLSAKLPAFRRRRGRASILAGAEILPVLEKTGSGWRAWRLQTGRNQPSGFEPPIKGRVGKSNSRDNPFSNRDAGIWELADICVVQPETEPGHVAADQLERT